MSVGGKFLGGVGSLLDVVVQVERLLFGLGEFKHLNQPVGRDGVALHPLLDGLDRELETASLKATVQLAATAEAGYEFASVETS
jgi:hypothetical protein